MDDVSVISCCSLYSNSMDSFSVNSLFSSLLTCCSIHCCQLFALLPQNGRCYCHQPLFTLLQQHGQFLCQQLVQQLVDLLFNRLTSTVWAVSLPSAVVHFPRTFRRQKSSTRPIAFSNNHSVDFTFPCHSASADTSNYAVCR